MRSENVDTWTPAQDRSADPFAFFWFWFGGSLWACPHTPRIEPTRLHYNLCVNNPRGEPEPGTGFDMHGTFGLHTVLTHRIDTNPPRLHTRAQGGEPRGGDRRGAKKKKKEAINRPSHHDGAGSRGGSSRRVGDNEGGRGPFEGGRGQQRWRARRPAAAAGPSPGAAPGRDARVGYVGIDRF